MPRGSSTSFVTSRCIDGDHTVSSHKSPSTWRIDRSSAGGASCAGNVADASPLDEPVELPGYSWYIDDPSSPLPNATNTAAGMASNGTAELRLRTANTTLAASSTLDPDREGSPVKIDDSGLFWAELASASAGGT